MKNGIYLVATPIGNIGDISFRAVEVLKGADIVACEDTRVAKKLFSLLGLSTAAKTFVVMHDHNEQEVASELVKAAAGKIVAYVSDAGSPLISDPGYKLAKYCRAGNVYLTTVPGACAAVCALQLSGLPSNGFLFAGFIPNKDKARREALAKYKDVADVTLIFYETANRLLKTLEAAREVFGCRELAVAREITKLHEECRSGTAADLIEYYTANPPKGEIVLLAGAQDKKETAVDYTEALICEMQTNRLKTAVENIVSRFGLPRGEVYRTALRLKNGQ